MYMILNLRCAEKWCFKIRKKSLSNISELTTSMWKRTQQSKMLSNLWWHSMNLSQNKTSSHSICLIGLRMNSTNCLKKMIFQDTCMYITQMMTLKRKRTLSECLSKLVEPRTNPSEESRILQNEIQRLILRFLISIQNIIALWNGFFTICFRTQE